MEPVKYGFSAKQIIEEGRITEEQIDNIKSWLMTQRFPKLTEEQILLFLLSNFNEEEATKSTIKAFYATRNANPELFDSRDISRDDIQNQLSAL